MNMKKTTAPRMISIRNWAPTFKTRPMGHRTAANLCRNGLVPGAAKDEFGFWSVPAGSKDPRRPVGRPKVHQ